MLAQQVIAHKRDGGTLTRAEIDAFVAGLVDATEGGWSDSQVAALAMAIVWRGMDAAETVALTQAMTQSLTVSWTTGRMATTALVRGSAPGAALSRTRRGQPSGVPQDRARWSG